MTADPRKADAYDLALRSLSLATAELFAASKVIRQEGESPAWSKAFNASTEHIGQALRQLGGVHPSTPDAIAAEKLKPFPP